MNIILKFKNIFNHKNKAFKIIIALALPIIFDFLVYSTVDFSKDFFTRVGCIYAIYGLIFIFKLMNKNSDKIKKIIDLIMKYRYLIAVIILIISVMLQVNFSSINMWYSYLGEPEEENIVMGDARAIRTDEWVTQSSLMLGQASADNHEIYNPNIAEGNNNMLLISAPTKDILEIVRPLLWGFLINKEIGFSFYFVFKMITLIMVSIELIRKITGNNNLLSLVGGIVLGLAPPMMWWFSTAVVDGYIYGTLIIVLFSLYMNNLNFSIWKKIAIALGILISIGGFAISLYPAFQVPYAFVILIFIISDFLKNRKKLEKKDYIIMSITILAIVALITRFIIISYEDIKLMMGTVYPGNRLATGGTEKIDSLVGHLTNIFFPYRDNFGNVCEASTYIYPFIGLLILITFFIKDYKDNKKKNNEKLFLALICLYGIFLFWNFIGFNTLFSKITLLYFSPAKRTRIILGIVGTLLSFGLINIVKNKNYVTKKQGILISTGVIIIAYVLLKNSAYGDILTPIYYMICLTMLFAMTYFLVIGKIKHWCFTMLIVALIGGVYVNPIMIGIKPVTETEIAYQIRNIASEDKQAMWISDGSITGQYIIANGAKCLNGVNIYPNFSWLNKVDPNKDYNQVYNRFAHIGVFLSNETKFELIASDSYAAYLTYENLKDIGAKYYFTKQQIDQSLKDEFHLVEKYANDEKRQYIFEIK